MEHFLRIVFALDRLDEMSGLLQKKPARSSNGMNKKDCHLPAGSDMKGFTTQA